MATWRNGYAEDCKSLYPSSILGVASKINLVLILKKSKLRFLHSSVAQLVEQLTVNQLVAGSSPARGAKKKIINSLKINLGSDKINFKLLLI